MGDKPRIYRPNHASSGATRTLQPKQAQKLSPAKQGYDRHWRRFRLAYLNENPLCVRCMEGGRVVPATIVDHIIPLSQGGAHKDEANSQSLCKYHHDLKTATEDGGFGKLRKIGTVDIRPIAVEGVGGGVGSVER